MADDVEKDVGPDGTLDLALLRIDEALNRLEYAEGLVFSVRQSLQYTRATLVQVANSKKPGEGSD